MATVIRLARYGSIHKPIYRVVVQDKRSARDGRFIEHIGSFNPAEKDAKIQVKQDRLNYWLGVGAQMSDTVRTRLSGKVRKKKAPKKTTQAKVETPAEA